MSERFPFGKRVRVGRKQWRTVVSMPHPHRRGCYVHRDGQMYTQPELVPDGEPAHVEPTLSPLPKRTGIARGPQDHYRDEDGQMVPIVEAPLSVGERDAEAVRRARQGPFAIAKGRA